VAAPAGRTPGRRGALAPLTGFLPVALAGGLAVSLLVVRARTPARLIPGVLAASLVVFLVFFPVTTAMPMDSDLPYFAQALLPTWETGFRFFAGSGGLPAGLLVIGLPLALVAAGAWSLIAWLDARAGVPGAARAEDPADSAGA